MKPLSANKLQGFVERFDNFKDGEFRSLEVISPIVMKAVFAVQDSARAFDWLTIELEFNGVSDARLVDEKKLSLIDMADGISLVSQDNSLGFAIGNYNNLSSLTNSTCYIISSTIKYKEGQF